MGAVSKIAKGKRARAVVFHGTKEKTYTGMTKSDLIKNKRGKIVSKKASLRAKKNTTSRAGLLPSRRPGRLWASRASSRSRRAQISIKRPRNSTSEHASTCHGFSSGCGDVYALRAPS